MDLRGQSFLQSPMVSWVKTFDDSLLTIEDLANGYALNKVMNAVDPVQFPLSRVTKSVEGTQGRLENLELLVNRIVEFYETSLQHVVVATLPNVAIIAQEPTKDHSLNELEKLMMLLLGCVVQCEHKGPLIEKMKRMEVAHQHALVSCIQQVTQTMDYVCSYDWTSFEDIPKENVEALCQTAFQNLYKITKERDQMFKKNVELTMETNYFKETQENGLVGNDTVSPLMVKHFSGNFTPSPQINPEVMDLRTKLRNLQEQLDQKDIQLAEVQEQVQEAKNLNQKLQLEKREMFEELHSQKVFREEMESLQAQAAKVERLEYELQRYKEKVEDLDYMKKTVEDLRSENEMMKETKALLEEKASSLLSRADAYDDVKTENTSLKVVIDSLNHEKEIDIRRMEELIEQSSRLELENSALNEKMLNLERLLREEQERLSAVEETGIVSGSLLSNISMEMSEEDRLMQAKLLRLEKEAVEHDRTKEELRVALARAAELDKSNKKHYEQAHVDKKTIIKLTEEVERLKVKASRADKLHAELAAEKEKFEEVDLLRAKVKELKSRKEQALDSKAKLEDELESLRAKSTNSEELQLENATIKAQYDALAAEMVDQQNRVEELYSQNALVESEKQKWISEVESMKDELELLRNKQPASSAALTIITPPRVSEAEMAAKAKVQRLEKEVREMHRIIDDLRQSKAKGEELTKANKKLNDQVHQDRKEIIKLNGELQVANGKVNKLEASQGEMRLLRQQSEEAEMAKKQIKELKQQINLLIEAKAYVEEERNDMKSKIDTVAALEEERLDLRGRLEALELEREDSSHRVQELLEQNNSLEVEKNRKDIEIKELSELIGELKKQQKSSESTPTGVTITIRKNSQSVKEEDEKETIDRSQLVKLEKEKTEVESLLTSLKKSSAAAQEELARSNRRLTAELQSLKKENMRLKEEVSREKGQKAQLTNDLVKVKEDFRKSVMLMDELDIEEKLKEREEKTRESKRIEEIETRIDEAYRKTLATKEDRIKELQKRLDESFTSNQKLQEEVQTIKKQTKVQRINSTPISSPMVSRADRQATEESPLHAVLTVGPSDLARLKEKAGENSRLKDKMEALKEDNQGLVAELMDSRALNQEMEASNIRLQDRCSMQEQMISNLEEQNRTMLQQVNTLLEQNRELLMKTLSNQDKYQEDERAFKGKVEQLEFARSHLAQELEAQKKEAVMRELELYKKQQKKPGIFKRGLHKLNKKIKGRQSTSQSTVAIDGFGHSRSGTFTTTVSYTSGISGMMRQDSNASVDEEQSLSPSTGPSEGDLHDPNLFPPMNSSPKTPGRQSGGRAHTLPRMGMDDVSFSSKTTPGRDVLTLEDFLAEDDTPKTKRREIELSTVSHHLSPRSMSTSKQSPVSTSSIEPRSEKIEIPSFLKKGVSPSQKSKRGNIFLDLGEQHSQASQLSQVSSHRDSNLSTSSSHSSRSSGMNRLVDSGSLNQNFNSNNMNGTGQFKLHPTSVVQTRGRAHTLDSTERRNPASKRPPTGFAVMRVPVREYHSSGTLIPKNRRSEEYFDSLRETRNRRKLTRSTSNDILVDSPARRRYSEIPAGYQLRRASSGDVLDDNQKISSLAALTNIDEVDKKKLDRSGQSAKVTLDLNSSVGSGNSAWYDYGAV